MKKCTTCKGSGEVKLHVTEWLQDGKHTSTTVIKCVECDGKGKLTDAQEKELQAQRDAWCVCGNPSQEAIPYSYSNGAHGWDCKDCGKLLQTG